MEYALGFLFGMVATAIAARSWLYLGMRYFRRGQMHFGQANEQYDECLKLHTLTKYTYDQDMELREELRCIHEDLQSMTRGGW